VVLVLAAFLEFVVFPKLEQSRALPSEAWERDTALYNRNGYIKWPYGTAVYESDSLKKSKTKSRKRILVIGDSFCWGHALANINDVWWRLLQREIDNKGYDVEVISAAECGASTAKQLAYLRFTFPTYNPDLVIFGYVTNDPDQGFVRQLPPDTAPKQWGQDGFSVFTEALHTCLPRLAYQMKRLRMAKICNELSSESNGYDYREWERMIYEGANFDAFKLTARNLNKALQEFNVPAFVVALPYSPDPAHRNFYEIANAAFQEGGVKFYNIYPEFLAEVADGRPVIMYGATPNDGHPGTECNHFSAVKTLEILEKEYPSVLGQPTKSVSRVPVINDSLPARIRLNNIAPSTWEFTWPDEKELPRMPVNEPFVQLNFETPVNIESLSIHAPGAASIRAHLTQVDALKGYDPWTLAYLSPQKGTDASWQIGHLPLVNTLRLTVKLAPLSGPLLEPQIPLPPGLEKEQGHCWLAPIGEYASRADNNDLGIPSTLILYEDGREIGPSNQVHADIRALGNGRHSHWGPYLYFSTSDNSNPLTNGRQYSMAFRREAPRNVRILLKPSQ
jgi:hypothetical protein